MAELNFKEWTPGRRKARAQAKERLVLAHLHEHGWSTREVVAELLRFKHAGKAHAYLRGLARRGLVWDHKLPIVGRYQTIWTADPKFRISTVSKQLDHVLDIQRLMLRASRSGWYNLVRPGHGLVQEGDAFPDFVGIAPNGGKVAVEVERSPRSNYGHAIVPRLLKRKAEGWTLLLYLCPTEALAATVRERIGRFTHKAGQADGAHMIINGNRERVPDNLATWVRVVTYADFSGIAVGNSRLPTELPTVSGILQ